MNNHQILFPIVAVLGVFIPIVAFGYEVGTHSRMTLETFRSSAVAGSEFLVVLGIESQAEGIGNEYYDRYGQLEFRLRTESDATLDKKRGPAGVAPYSVTDWTVHGSIREDDYPDDGLSQADPDTFNPSLRRPLHHFYDPIHDQGLFVPGIAALDSDIHKSPDWAIGAVDSFSDANTPEPNRRNHFTVFDAREAEWRALTGLDRDGNTVAPDEAERNKYWATLFRSLGDVLHLIQDAAQPQHTRNEAHSGIGPRAVRSALTGHESFFEEYINDRALAGTLTYTGYSIPRFDDYLSYFTTRNLNADVLARTGIADYSNRGFFTPAKNLKPTDAEFDFPSNNAPDYGREAISLPGGQALTFFTNSVPDSVTGVDAQNVRLTTYSVWDAALEQRGWLPRYSLNRYNYDAMADLLVPRAVAYGAGLIDYFFRGRLDIDVQLYDRDRLRVRLINRAERDTLYSDNGATRLAASYRYKSNGDWVYGSGQALVPMAAGDDITPDATSLNTYEFIFSPAIPQGAESLELRVVARGRLGNETDAVAVGFKPMTSPGFVVTPSVLPADGIAGPRHVYMSDGQWKVSTATGLQFGQVDWKGHALSDVLTFDGPPTRYFYAENKTAYSDKIYRSGAVWARVPQGKVVGVAINDGASGRELVAVAWDNFGFWLRVYRRSFAEQYPNDGMYDQQTNPLGWRQLSEEGYGASGLMPRTPMFMNASGTEAQGIFGEFGTSDRFLKRMKLLISEQGVQRQELDAVSRYEESWADTNNADYQVQIAIGNDLGGCNVEDVCTGVMQACPNQNYSLCSRFQSQYTKPYSAHLIHTESTTTTNAGIIAVDYKDDIEVVGVIGRDRSIRHRDIVESYTYGHSADAQRLTACGEIDSTTGQSQTWDYRFNGTNNRELYFQGGSIDISLDRIGDDFDVTEASSSISTQHNGAGTTTRAASLDRTDGHLEMRTAISYIDMRHGLAGYSQYDYHTTTHSTGSGPWNPTPAPGTYSATQVRSGATERRAVVEFQGQAYTLGQDVVDDSFSVDYQDQVLSFVPSGTCPGSSPYSAGNTNQYSDTAETGWLYLHPEWKSGDSGMGYAVDAYGNVVVSQSIWIQQPNNTYQKQGTWNFLNKGDLKTLFGITAQEVYFWPLGLY